MRGALVGWFLAAIAGFSGAEELRHRGTITALVKDDTGMLASSQSGIHFHSLANAQRLRRHAKPGFRVQSLALAVDGVLFAAGGTPGESAMLARITNESLREAALPGKDLAYGVAVSATGAHIAVALADGSVMIAATPTSDLAQVQWSRQHQHTATALAVAFSPDGSVLASCGHDGVLIVSEPANPDREPYLIDDHTAGIECLAFSPDGKWIASGSRDSKVRVHDTAQGRLVRTFSGLGMEDEPVAGRVIARITSLAWSGQGMFAGTSNGALYRLSETDDHETRLLAGNAAAPISALCAVDDQLFVAVDEDLRTVPAGGRTSPD